jgi:hypothetical protein
MGDKSMKYKVNDKVRVRKDLECGRWYGAHSFVRNMEHYKGDTVTITFVGSDYYAMYGSSYLITDEMLEPIEQTYEIVCRMPKVGEWVINIISGVIFKHTTDDVVWADWYATLANYTPPKPTVEEAILDIDKDMKGNEMWETIKRFIERGEKI